MRDVGVLLEWLLNASIQVAILAGIVWLVTRFCRKAPASLSYFLWVLVLVKALVPTPQCLSLKLPVLHEKPKPEYSLTISGGTKLGFIGSGTPDNPAPLIHTSPREDQRVATAWLSLPRLLVLLWAAGALIMLVRLLFRMAGQRRLLKGVADADAELVEFLGTCADRMGVRRIPRIAYSEHAPAPMLIGVFRPTVLVPVGIFDACNRSDLSAMLLHELAHLKSRHMLSVWLFQFVQAVFFFHPAVWLIGRALEDAVELACDQSVIASSVISRQEYAKGFISAVRLANGISRVTASLGMVASSIETEARRLRSILNSATPRFTARWLLICTAVVMVGISMPTMPDKEDAVAGIPGVPCQLSSDHPITSADLAIERAIEVFASVGWVPDDKAVYHVSYEKTRNSWCVSTSNQCFVCMDMRGRVLTLVGSMASNDLDDVLMITRDEAEHLASRYIDALGLSGLTSDTAKLRRSCGGRAWEIRYLRQVGSSPGDEDKPLIMLLDFHNGAFISLNTGIAPTVSAEGIVRVSRELAIQEGLDYAATHPFKPGRLRMVHLEALQGIRELGSSMNRLRLVWVLNFDHRQIVYVDSDTGDVWGSSDASSGTQD